MTTHIQLRDARDRLLDLLGLGQTYPLRDLAIPDERLMVPFDTTAKIPIENSQQGVLYQLYYKQAVVTRTAEGQKDGDIAIQDEGNGATLLLETYKIQENVTFDILATKQSSGKQAYLHQTAAVKVGLDTKLLAEILDAPLLELTNDSPTAPRIIDYGQTVQVKIENSQEEVDYQLVYFKAAESGQGTQEVPLSKTGRREQDDPILQTEPISEDTDIRIRATKTFAEQIEPQTALLDVVLPLKVRANPALLVAVDPASIIDYKQPTMITIADTQQSASYQVFIRPILDRDFVRTATATDVLNVKVENEPDVQIRLPALGPVWTTPDGYAAVGDFQPGNGGKLQFALPLLIDDCLVIVQAQKAHQSAQVVTTVATSAVPLAQIAAVLVRPNPAPSLRVRVALNETTTDGELQVFDGQPGVFYHFRTDKGSELGLPAYFHKRDDGDVNLNKGLGQLAVEVDFVIVRPLLPPADGADAPIQPPLDLAATPPTPPLLTTGPLPTGASLQIQAVKAQTGVATPLPQPITIMAPPKISLQDVVVDYNSATKLLVSASQVGDKYQPFLNGASVKQTRNGNGNDLSFNTDALTEDTAFEMLIIRPGDSGVTVERIVKLLVTVRPNAKLSASPVSAIVDYNSGTTLRIETSQPGVNYQLLVGEKAVGDPVAGSGDTIELATGPLTETTTFVIRAAKLANPDISVTLGQPLSVEVRPNPTLTVRAVDEEVAYNSATKLQVAASQPGVNYQLRVDEKAVGDPVVGSGDIIELTTGPLTETTTFMVRVAKLANLDNFVDLAQQVTVKVQPKPDASQPQAA